MHSIVESQQTLHSNWSPWITTLTQSEAKGGTRFLSIPGMRARVRTKQGFFAGLLLPALHYMTGLNNEQVPACSVALISLATLSAHYLGCFAPLWEQNICKKLPASWSLSHDTRRPRLATTLSETRRMVSTFPEELTGPGSSLPHLAKREVLRFSRMCLQEVVARVVVSRVPLQPVVVVVVRECRRPVSSV